MCSASSSYKYGEREGWKAKRSCNKLVRVIINHEWKVIKNPFIPCKFAVYNILWFYVECLDYWLLLLHHQQQHRRFKLTSLTNLLLDHMFRIQILCYDVIRRIFAFITMWNIWFFNVSYRQDHPWRNRVHGIPKRLKIRKAKYRKTPKIWRKSRFFLITQVDLRLLKQK